MIRVGQSRKNRKLKFKVQNGWLQVQNDDGSWEQVLETASLMTTVELCPAVMANTPYVHNIGNTSHMVLEFGIPKGKDGKDGTNGLNGASTNGVNGTNGKDGKDGKDGINSTAIINLVGTITISQTAVIAIVAGIRTLDIPLTGITTDGIYMIQPVGALPAGYAIHNCISTAPNSIKVTMTAPLLAIGASYSFQAKVIKLTF